MPYLIAALLSVHALSAVFWAGSTLAQVAHGGDVAPPLRGPQLAAAALAIVSGGALWANLHAGAFGTGEVILLSGAAAAICALAAQVALRTRVEPQTASQRRCSRSASSRWSYGEFFSSPCLLVNRTSSRFVPSKRLEDDRCRNCI